MEYNAFTLLFVSKELSKTGFSHIVNFNTRISVIKLQGKLFFRKYHFTSLCLLAGGGGHSNTSVVHIHDQSFSKFPNQDFVLSWKSTSLTKFCVIFAPNFAPLHKFFGEHIWWNRGGF